MGRLLADTHPELRTEFLYCVDKNGNRLENKTFNTLSTCSGFSAMWECPKFNCDKKCQHVYQARISHRTSDKSGCPYCFGRKVCPCNSLASKYPEIAKQWDFKNNTEKPEEIAAHSTKKINWICDKSSCEHPHRWSSTVSNRTGLNQRGCPFCAKQKRCACMTFGGTYPDLIVEWDYEKNIGVDPHQIACFSKIRANWKCKICKCLWQSLVYNRTSGTGCPKCRKSKMEKSMELLLTDLVMQKKIKSYHSQYPLPGTLLKADFIITLNTDNQIIVEMDGVQHFEPKSFGSHATPADEMFLDVVRCDGEKKDWCEKHNVRLLRLSYLVKEEDYAVEVMDFINQPNVCFRLVGEPNK